MRAPPEWEPSNACRFSELRLNDAPVAAFRNYFGSPAYCLNDAPAASHRSRRRHLVHSDPSMPRVGLQFTTLPFDPSLYFVIRKEGWGVGAFITHIDELSGCGKPGVLERTQVFSQARFRTLELQESSFAPVGAELPRGKNHSARFTRPSSRLSWLPWEPPQLCGRLDSSHCP